MEQERQAHHRSQWEQAELHASRKEWAQARRCFLELLDSVPEDPGVLVQLSYIESLAGHYRAAREFALRAHRAGPRDPAVVGELVARLRTFNAARELQECVERLGPVDRIPIPQLLACAAQYSYLNDQERALTLLDEARRADPDYPPTLLARGQVLTYLGRFDEAEADIARCLARAPEIARGWWLLSRLRKQTEDRNHVGQIEKQLRQPGRKPADVAMLAYALHKEMDDLGRHREAWSALELACRAKRSILRYDAEETRALVSALIEFPKPPPMPVALHAERVPIFIVGMHRSGTTLLEQLLDGHPEVKGIGELYDFTSQMRYATDHHCPGVMDLAIVERARDIDFGAIGSGYLQGVEWRLGPERFFTDKLPSNFLNVGFVCLALPGAKILHMRRDPIETCFSNLRELFSDANAYSYDLRELAHYYRQYRRLMAHWHAVFPGRILEVDYQALVNEPEHTLRRVSGFCGMSFEPGMLDLTARTRAVSTASAIAVRERVLSRKTSKWVPYAEQLRPLIDDLMGHGV